MLLFNLFYASSLGFTSDGGYDSQDLNVDLIIEIHDQWDETYSLSKQEPDSLLTYSILRYAGCYGNVHTAKQTLLPSKDILEEPKFDNTAFTLGKISIDTSSKPFCVLYDNFQGITKLDESILDLREYVATNIWKCTNPKCEYEPCLNEIDEIIDMDDWESAITDVHRKKYDQYNKSRQETISKNRSRYAQYQANYSQWEQRRKTTLSQGVVHYQIQSSYDLPQGHIGIYSYRWNTEFSCGELYEVDREDMQIMYLDLAQPIKKGQVLNIWLKDADINATWGFVLGSSFEVIYLDIENIKGEVYNLKSLWENGSGPTLDTLPTYLKNRAAESSKGLNTTHIVEDCDC